MSDPTAATETEPAVDELRQAILADLTADLGDAVIESHLVPGVDLWVRVTAEAWGRAAEALKARGFEYFCFLSAIDWMPSPFGKSEDDPFAETDDEPDSEPPAETVSGYAGGQSRFQLLARLTDIERHIGITLKSDVPDEMVMPTWVEAFAGANWHEREAHEMFGIGFAGHPDLRNMYLPGDFEGHPLRKDFPLLSRMVKPWPGIVDVEPMPVESDEEST